VRFVTLFVGLVILPSFGIDNVNFDGSKPGTTPPYWSLSATRATVPPRWEVIRDPRAPTRQNALAQVSPSGSDSQYIYDRAVCADGDLSVKFRITGGKQSRTAGIVWRYQDENNYYLLDFSADQNRIALYRVQDGQIRSTPVAAVKHEIRLNQWYVAKVTFQGSKVRVSFGNRRIFDAVDTGIQAQGKTGLWTKAGTMAEFDDYRVARKANFSRSELSRIFRR
jgi:hypothetical protein